MQRNTSVVLTSQRRGMYIGDSHSFCLHKRYLFTQSTCQALARPDSGNIVTKDHLTGKILRAGGGGVTKVRRPRPRDENGNGTPYVHRKTTSLGALGQALHGPLMGELQSFSHPSKIILHKIPQCSIVL